MMISFSQPVCRVPISPIPVSHVGSCYFLQNLPRDPVRVCKDLNLTEKTRLGGCKRKKRVVCGAGLIFPVDPWAPNIDSQSIASQLFAFSLFPYIGFLYYITKSKSAPKLTLFGFYFLLAFVGATIPAGIYAKLDVRMVYSRAVLVSYALLLGTCVLRLHSSRVLEILDHCQNCYKES